MTLHPKAVTFLQELAEADPPAWSELPPAESREIFSSFTDLFGEGPQLHEIIDLPHEAEVPMRLYRPSDASGLGAVAFFHGGGWVLGDLETHDTLCRHLALASGRLIASVDYRLAPEHCYPAAIDDSYAATCYLSDHARQLGINPQKLAVAGDSAGGNLAAAVALRSRNESGPEIDGQVLIYPVVEPDFDTGSYHAFANDYMLTRESMQWFWDQYLPEGDRKPELAALRDAVLENLPPALVLTAEYDVLRDEGEHYARALQVAGNLVRHQRFEGMLHGFVHFSGLFQEDGLAAIKMIGEFLNR